MITNTWLIFGIFAVMASFSIWSSKYTKWGNYLGYVNIAVILGLIAVNVKLVPEWSDIHDLAFNYCVPIAVVLVLLQADLRIIKKVGGKLLIVLASAIVFTMIAAIAGGLIFDCGPETYKVFASYAAGYVGNAQTLNLVASALNLDAGTLVFVNASDSVIYIFYSLILFQCGKWAFMKKKYRSYKDLKNTGLADTSMEQYNPDDDIKVSSEETAVVLGAAIGIVALGQWLGEVTGILSLIFYVAIAVLIANVTPIKKYKINDKIGTWLFCMFMVAIGACAPFSVLASAPKAVVIGCAFVIFTTMILFVIFGKIFKFPLEYMLISSMACIGGAVSTPPLAQSYKWNDLVLPGLFCGIIAQVLGSYCGLLVGSILQAIG